MREIIEKCKCDKCGTVIVKDTGLWYGSQIVIKESHIDVRPWIDRIEWDLCPICTKKFKELMKI